MSKLSNNNPSDNISNNSNSPNIESSNSNSNISNNDSSDITPTIPVTGINFNDKEISLTYGESKKLVSNIFDKLAHFTACFNDVTQHVRCKDRRV